MEDLLSLNSSTTKSIARMKRFDDLQEGTYIIKSFQLKETTFGLRVVVQIDNFYLALPPRFSDKINSEDQILELNSKKWTMVYGGKDAKEFNKLIIDFKPLKDGKHLNQTTDEDDDDDVDDDSAEENNTRAASAAKKKREKAGGSGFAKKTKQH